MLNRDICDMALTELNGDVIFEPKNVSHRHKANDINNGMVTTANVQPTSNKYDIHYQKLSMYNTTGQEPEESKEYSALQEEDGRSRVPKNSVLIDKLKSVRERYSSSFTIHALNHIIGGTVPEKIFWTIKLITAISLAVYLSWSLFVAYFKHDVNSKLEKVVKNAMHVPGVYICGKDYNRYLYSYNDCSTNMSKSYDIDICTTLNQQCPPFFKNLSYYRRMLKVTNYTEGNISCAPEVLGQCISLSPFGKVLTSQHDHIMYEQSINTSMLPLYLLIHQPGLGEMAAHGFYHKQLNRLGYYHFALEKTTISRLPYPYSNPSCVVQGSTEAKTKNMFIGSYTISKCRTTCRTKLDLMCGRIKNVFRVNARDKVSLRKLLKDKILSQFQECSDNNMRHKNNNVLLDECLSKCFQPCLEEDYSVHGFFRTAKENEKLISLKFFFKSMEETAIVESPSFEISTLLSNFGGTLGLMTGMSAISIIEVVIWLILLIVERIYLAGNKLTSRSTEHDSMV